jgi:hypothetical protein
MCAYACPRLSLSSLPRQSLNLSVFYACRAGDLYGCHEQDAQIENESLPPEIFSIQRNFFRYGQFISTIHLSWIAMISDLSAGRYHCRSQKSGKRTCSLAVVQRKNNIAAGWRQPKQRHLVRGGRCSLLERFHDHAVEHGYARERSHGGQTRQPLSRTFLRLGKPSQSRSRCDQGTR